MRTILYIGIGGFLGAVLRFVINNWQVFNIISPLPLSILIINISGCLVLAFFLRLAFDVWEMDPDLRLGVSTGLIGAFTTFSTLCRDITGLLSGGHTYTAAAYIMLSVTMGLAAVYLGDLSGRGLINLISDRNKVQNE